MKRQANRISHTTKGSVPYGEPINALSHPLEFSSGHPKVLFGMWFILPVRLVHREIPAEIQEDPANLTSGSRTVQN